MDSGLKTVYLTVKGERESCGVKKSPKVRRKRMREFIVCSFTTKTGTMSETGY